MLALIATILAHNKSLVVTGKETEDFSNKLYLSILQELVIKMQMKAFIRKEKYNLQLSPSQAICFWICFSGWAALHRTTHIGNIIAIMCETIYNQIICKNFFNM